MRIGRIVSYGSFAEIFASMGHLEGEPALTTPYPILDRGQRSTFKTWKEDGDRRVLTMTLSVGHGKWSNGHNSFRLLNLHHSCRSFTPNTTKTHKVRATGITVGANQRHSIATDDASTAPITFLSNVATALSPGADF